MENVSLIWFEPLKSIKIIQRLYSLDQKAGIQAYFKLWASTRPVCERD